MSRGRFPVMPTTMEARRSRMRLRRAARRGVSAGLEEWLDYDGPTTLGTLNDTFGPKILAAACLALMAPSAIPLPTGGATHVFDILAIVFAIQMMTARRSIWLPTKWRQRELGPKAQKALRLLIRFVKRCERVSRRRLPKVMASRGTQVVLGTVIAVFIVASFLSPPFSGLDTLPSLGVVLISLGILMEDALFAGIGIAVGAGGIGLAIGFGVQAIHLIKNLVG